MRQPLYLLSRDKSRICYNDYMEGNNRGFFILLAASFFYASYGIFSKIIGGSFQPFTQAWTRGLITLACFICFGLITKQFVKINKTDFKYFLTSGIIGSLAIGPTFYSLAFLHLGTALFIQYAATVITSYTLGRFMLKEKLNKISLMALVLALLGLALVYRGDIYFNKLIPVLAAIASGTFFSIYFVFSKKISTKYPTNQINTFGYTLAVFINLLIAIILGERFNTNFASSAWIANVGYGIAGFIGSGLTVYGFKFIDAHKGSIVLLSEIVFGVLFGLFLFNELLNATIILGGILIMIAAVLPNIYQLLKTNKLVIGR